MRDRDGRFIPEDSLLRYRRVACQWRAEEDKTTPNAKLTRVSSPLSQGQIHAFQSCLHLNFCIAWKHHVNIHMILWWFISFAVKYLAVIISRRRIDRMYLEQGSPKPSKAVHYQLAPPHYRMACFGLKSCHMYRSSKFLHESLWARLGFSMKYNRDKHTFNQCLLWANKGRSRKLSAFLGAVDTPAPPKKSPSYQNIEFVKWTQRGMHFIFSVLAGNEEWKKHRSVRRPGLTFCSEELEDPSWSLPGTQRSAYGIVHRAKSMSGSSLMTRKECCDDYLLIWRTVLPRHGDPVIYKQWDWKTNDKE